MLQTGHDNAEIRLRRLGNAPNHQYKKIDLKVMTQFPRGADVFMYHFIKFCALRSNYDENVYKMWFISAGLSMIAILRLLIFCLHG